MWQVKYICINYASVLNVLNVYNDKYFGHTGHIMSIELFSETFFFNKNKTQ